MKTAILVPVLAGAAQHALHQGILPFPIDAAAEIHDS